MKLNWGYGILIAIITMVLALLGLVFMSVNESIELVNEDYYPKGLVYEQEIQKQKHAAQLENPIEIDINKEIKISFPPEFQKPELITGEIWFYRASDISSDLKDSISLDSTGSLLYPLSQFAKGKYDIIIDWNYDGKAYLQKTPIYIE